MDNNEVPNLKITDLPEKKGSVNYYISVAEIGWGYAQNNEHQRRSGNSNACQVELGSRWSIKWIHIVTMRESRKGSSIVGKHRRRCCCVFKYEEGSMCIKGATERQKWRQTMKIKTLLITVKLPCFYRETLVDAGVPCDNS